MRLAARGLPLVIVNPAQVMGAGDPGRSSTTLVRRFMRRQIPAYVNGTLNIVGVDDVARGHLLADERGTVGERYILGNRNFTFDSAVRRSGPPLRGRAARAEAAAAARPGAGRAPCARPACERRALRDPCLLAELGVRQQQGQTRAPVEALAARGLPRGDDRVVPRARRESAGPSRGAPAAGPADRRGRAPAARGCRRPQPLIVSIDGDAVPLHYSDRLAVPVRQGRPRTPARRDRV